MTLEQLIAQRAELDKQIKELKDMEVVTCGTAKIDRQSGPDTWYLAIRSSHRHDGYRSEWKKVCSSSNRQDVVNRIDEIIKALEELNEKIMENGKL